MAITVIDSMCGTGKTTYMLNKMLQKCKNGEKFIFVTPFLSECNRVIDFMKNNNIHFYEPKTLTDEGMIEQKGSKINGLNLLIEKGYNIVTTHANFKNVNSTTIKLLECNKYNFVLDEVIDLIIPLDITISEMQYLVENEYMVKISECEYKTTDKKYSDGVFKKAVKKIQSISKDQSIKTINGKTFVWMFSEQIFGLFNNITILTYMFSGQILSVFLKINKFDYNIKSVNNINGKVVLTEYEKFDASIYKNYIDIIAHDKLNSIGNSNFALSSSWYDNASDDDFNLIKKNLVNFFKNITKTTKRHQNMVTIFHGKKFTSVKYELDNINKNDLLKYSSFNKISAQPFKHGFVSSNSRATNEFCDRTSLAYMINKFCNPLLVQYSNYYKIEMNEDLYALSEMVQWIFRSGIRKNTPDKITIYIPSKRMRNLLIKWLNNEI